MIATCVKLNNIEARSQGERIISLVTHMPACLDVQICDLSALILEYVVSEETVQLFSLPPSHLLFLCAQDM